MRIISGTLKGRKIQAPNNLPIRPTTDFAKEALFNILNHKIHFNEVSVLDLFAGIGSISLEFASRGCPKITAIDQHQACVNFLNETAQKLELTQAITVFKEDVFKYLTQKPTQQYQIIFADPPYDLDENQYLNILQNIFDNNYNWLSNNSYFILEHPKHIQFNEHPNFTLHKKYGNVHFSFFE